MHAEAASLAQAQAGKEYCTTWTPSSCMDKPGVRHSAHCKAGPPTSMSQNCFATRKSETIPLPPSISRASATTSRPACRPTSPSTLVAPRLAIGSFLPILTTIVLIFVFNQFTPHQPRAPPPYNTTSTLKDPPAAEVGAVGVEPAHACVVHALTLDAISWLMRPSSLSLDSRQHISVIACMVR